MPLPVRSISASVAILCFFAIAVIGGFSGLSPFTCCKRSLAAAAIIYITVSLAVKSINIILIDAMIDSQMKQQKGKLNGSGN